MLVEFNEAELYKLSWDLIKKEKHWAKFLYARFMTSGVALSYYKSSSICPGINHVLSNLKTDLAWQIG